MDNTINASTTNWYVSGSGQYSGSNVTIRVADDSKSCNPEGEVSPILYFKYVKSKFKLLERMKLDRRLGDIERAFDEAVENGQNALAKKFLEALAREARESALLAKGVKFYIEESDLNKYKHRIKGGHISDTIYEDYTRVIPKHVVSRKKELEGMFDELVIYHYWNPKAEDTEEMEEEEKEKMRDPILFGKIKETNKLYFIADWKDEYCDLTFDKLIKYLGKDKKQFIPNKPNISIKKK